MQKRILLLFVIIGCLAFLPVVAQEDAEEDAPATLSNEMNRTHVAKVNILSALNRTLAVFYEQSIGDYISLQPGFTYGRSRFGDDAQRLGILTEFRWYFAGADNAIVGLYTGPYAKYQSVKDEQEISGQTFTGTFRTFGAGWLLGRQWIARKGLTVDVFAGAGYNPFVTTEAQSLPTDPTIELSSEEDWRWDVRLGLSVGIAL